MLVTGERHVHEFELPPRHVNHQLNARGNNEYGNQQHNYNHDRRGGGGNGYVRGGGGRGGMPQVWQHPPQHSAGFTQHQQQWPQQGGQRGGRGGGYQSSYRDQLEQQVGEDGLDDQGRVYDAMFRIDSTIKRRTTNRMVEDGVGDSIGDAVEMEVTIGEARKTFSKFCYLFDYCVVYCFVVENFE